jgi:hypothetical protein
VRSVVFALIKIEIVDYIHNGLIIPKFVIAILEQRGDEEGKELYLHSAICLQGMLIKRAHNM